MKKALIAAVLFAFLLAGCSPSSPAAQDSDSKNIVVTTFPLYCFATAIAEGAENVTVSLLINQQISCLHDYTLTVDDMKAIEQADILIYNGAGFEDFLDSALQHADAVVIDCSEGLPLRTMPDGDDDPHIWMSPNNAEQMIQTIADGLSAADNANAARYAENAEEAKATLLTASDSWQTQLDALSCRELITFHDGFGYFADAFSLTILEAIEEEEGAEASAQEIANVVSLVQSHELPAIFTETYGATATAEAISRETGVQVYALNMIMSGEGSGLQPYLDAMQENIDTLEQALK